MNCEQDDGLIPLSLIPSDFILHSTELIEDRLTEILKIGTIKKGKLEVRCDTESTSINTGIYRYCFS